MHELALKFFPYPHVWRGERRDGLLVGTPERCMRCQARDCETNGASDLQLCRFGVNFWRVSVDLLVFGVLVRDYRPASDAYRKELRSVGPDAVRRGDLTRVVEECARTTEELQRGLAREQRRLINRYRRSQRYQQEIAAELRPELQRMFGQVHDYKQLVQRVIQNLDVHLEQRFRGLPMEEKVAKASHEETAIYWAARLMDEKLDASVLILNPDQISEPGGQRVFRFHGLVTKYLRIYQHRFDEKEIRKHEIGGSFVEVEGNPRAVGIIPHALIDNATKYAPTGSDVTISYAETADEVTFAVQSLGPRIAEDERLRIFDFFFRGNAAQKVDSGGTGFGLAAAQLVATTMGSRIKVEQSDRPTSGQHYATTFSVTFQIARKPAGPLVVDGGPRRGSRARGRR